MLHLKNIRCMPCIITCSSVRPTCPIGGWEKTAEGTVLSKIVIHTYKSTIFGDDNHKY
jgi:hypothetical protein